PITGATELSIRLLTHDAVDEQPTLLLESTYRMFHRVVERVVAGVAVGGVKQPQPVQQGLDFGDVVSGVAAAEYPHALLAFLWHRVNKLDAVCIPTAGWLGLVDRKPTYPHCAVRDYASRAGPREMPETRCTQRRHRCSGIAQQIDPQPCGQSWCG